MPHDAPAQDALTEYEVTVHTAAIEGAGTDADVSLIMFGSSGSDNKHHERSAESNECALHGCPAEAASSHYEGLLRADCLRQPGHVLHNLMS